MPIFKLKKAIVEEPPVATFTHNGAIAFLRENVLSPAKGLAKRLVPADGLDSIVTKFDENRFSLTLLAVLLFTVAVCIHGFATKASPPLLDEDEDEVIITQQPRSVPASIRVDESEVTKLTAELTAASSTASSGADDGSVSSTEPGADDEDGQSVEETYEGFRLKIIDTDNIGLEDKTQGNPCYSVSSDDALANGALPPPFAAAEEVTDAPVTDDVIVDNDQANQDTNDASTEGATDAPSADDTGTEESTAEETVGSNPDVTQEATVQGINIKEAPEANLDSQETKETSGDKSDVTKEPNVEGTPAAAANEKSGCAGVSPVASATVPNKKPSLKKRLSVRMKRSTSSNSLASAGSIRRRLVKINSAKTAK